MLSRLVESNYFAHRKNPTPKQIEFWLRELRHPDLLLEVAHRFPLERAKVEDTRPLLRLNQSEQLQASLLDEERQERELDRTYWLPLREELERLRHTH